MKTDQKFKQEVRKEILNQKQFYDISDAAYAKKLGISSSIYSRLKKGEIEGLIAEVKWFSLGFEHNVQIHKDDWQLVKTQVYIELEANLIFCKENSSSMILADCNGIGKTTCAKHISKGLYNTFYVDCSQAKDKRSLIKLMAKTVGLDNRGKFNELKDKFKYYVTTLDRPLIILDEFGDLAYDAFLMVKELYNGTEGRCAYYAMGAQALQNKMQRGIDNLKIGYAELFDRFSGEVTNFVPTGKEDKAAFFRELIGQVAKANLIDKSKVGAAIRACVTQEHNHSIRFLKTVILNSNAEA